MILEIYLFKFILFCIGAFIFGYFVIYLTITRGDHSKSFDTFYFFNKIALPSLFEFIWAQVILFIKFITLGKIELEEIKSKK